MPVVLKLQCMSELLEGFVQTQIVESQLPECLIECVWGWAWEFAGDVNTTVSWTTV